MTVGRSAREGQFELDVDVPPSSLDAVDGIASRERDLTSASALWRLSSEGTTQVLIFEGSDRTEMTSLLKAVSSPVVTPGAQVVRIASRREGPWGSVAEWVRGLGALCGAGDVSPGTGETLSALLHPGDHPWPPGDRSAALLSDGLFDLLSAVSLAQPTLLLIDDAHGVDPQSWQLLSRLVRFRPSFALFVVLTWSSRDSDADVRRDVEDWVSKGRVSLRAHGASSLTEGATDPPITVADGAAIAVVSSPDGDPVPQPSDPMEWGDSGPLEVEFLEQLDGLDEDALEVIRVLSKGDSATGQTLEYSTGLPSTRLGPVVSELARRKIVAAVGEGLGLLHPQIAQFVPERETPLRPASEVQTPVAWNELEIPPPPTYEELISRVNFRRTLRVRARTLAVVTVFTLIIWALFIR